MLEIGTSNGYSTIWLADAAEATGGRVVTLEIEPARTALARENLAHGGPRRRASSCAPRTPAEALRAFPDDAFDVVFLDAERPAYAGYWPDLVRILAPAGPPRGRQRHLARRRRSRTSARVVAADERVTAALVPIGAGVLLVAARRADLAAELVAAGRRA